MTKYQPKYPEYLQEFGINKEIWNAARDKLPDYLISSRGLNLRENFRCLNPEHEDPNPSMGYDPSGKVCYCFGCKKAYDIFDLIGMDYGINSFIARVKKACGMYGIHIDEPKQSQSIRKPGNDQTWRMIPGENKYNPTFTTEPESDKSAEDLQSSKSGDNHKADHPDQGKDYFPLIKAAASRFDHSPAEDYLKSRGISPETASKFAIGYDPAFSFSTGKKGKALIIPTGDMNHHLQIRNIEPNIPKDKRYEKRGSSALFNAKALQDTEKPIYIVEGEIDALSIIEAGGNAVGLGSTSGKRLLIEYLQKQDIKSRLILAMDNDEPGKKTGTEIAEKLEEMKIPFICFNPYGSYNDANEALTADRDSFIYRINHPDDARNEARADEYRKKVSASAHIDSLLDEIRRNKYNKPVSTGFPAFDETIDGGLYKGLYVIGAVSSVGKTTFCLQIADQIAESGHDVLIFSLEMSRNELMARSISRETMRIAYQETQRRDNAKTVRGILDGSRWETYTERDQERIKQAFKKYESYSDHVFIIEAEDRLSVNEIRSEIEKHKEVTGSYPVVIIDYLQVMQPADPHMSDKQSADHNITALRQIARDLPIITISSLNRESYNGKNKNKGVITMSDLKESGGIEYGADVIIALQFATAGEKDFSDKEAKREDPRQITSVVLKNRNGKVYGEAYFHYIAMFNYFTERRTQ